MDHFQREPRGSIIDIDMAARLTSTPRPAEKTGVDTIRATVADPGTGNPTEHVWLRDPFETERDFVAMALADARALGIATVQIGGTLSV